MDAAEQGRTSSEWDDPAVAPLVSRWIPKCERPDGRMWIGGRNREARRLVEAAMSGAPRPREGKIDIAVITPEDADEAIYFATKILPRIVERGAIWIARMNALEAGSASLRNDLLDMCQRVAGAINWSPGPIVPVTERLLMVGLDRPANRR